MLQHCFFSNGELYVGGIKSHKYESNNCLVDPGSGVFPRLHDCNVAQQKKYHMLWNFKQVNIFPTTKQSKCFFLFVWREEVQMRFIFLGRTYPEQRDEEMFRNYCGCRRLFQTGCSALQRSEVEDPTHPQRHCCTLRQTSDEINFFSKQDISKLAFPH